MTRALKDEIDESGKIYRALTQEQIRRLRNWNKGKDGTPIGRSGGAFDLVSTSNVYESKIPILYGDALDVEAAVRTLPGRYEQAVRQFWKYEGRSLRWHARHRQIENANSETANPNLHYETFESWVLIGHDRVMRELARRAADAEERRLASAAAIAASRPAEAGALRLHSVELTAADRLRLELKLARVRRGVDIPGPSK